MATKLGQARPMTAPHKRFGSVLLFATGYVVVGVVAAGLAKSAHSPQMVTAWRVSAWLLSLILFAGHLLYEHLRAGNTTARAALRTAMAVALGALVLAVVGPARTRWGTEDFWRVALLSLALWPILTGIPAFLVALLGESILGRVVRREKSAVSSRVA